MIKFDYNTNNLHEAIGMTSIELESLSDRLADKSLYLQRKFK
jgi:hypothetical protein